MARRLYLNRGCIVKKAHLRFGASRAAPPGRNEFGHPAMKHLIDRRASRAGAVQPTVLKGKRAASVMYSSYPGDPRPRRAAEALAGAQMAIDVICLKENDEELRKEVFNGVSITRLPLKRRRGGKLSYLVQYGSFILLAGVILAVRTLKRRYDLVHIHNMPDVLVFSALIPKLFGAKVILDLHDPMPELMMTIFGLQVRSYPVRLLKGLERLSIRFADAVVTTNEAFRKLFLSRGCPPDKISVVMNSPDEKIFRYLESTTQESGLRDELKPFVIMYHGSLVERHGLDLAVSAVGLIKSRIPKVELRVYGRSTPFLERVMDSVGRSELADAVKYLGPMALEKIPAAVRECDIGVIPNRRSTFTELNMPTRIFEYLSQGKMAIVPRTPGICDYFDAQELVLFELGDVADLAEKIIEAFLHPVEMEKMVKRGQRVYLAHQWGGERPRFIALVNSLLSR
jgi:glycosyltransferase involved in cell wall biosynthesis